MHKMEKSPVTTVPYTDATYKVKFQLLKETKVSTEVKRRGGLIFEYLYLYG